MRHRVSLDANHAEIVRSLRAVGARVIELARLGASPDLLVYFRGRVYVAELKDGSNGLEPSQKALIADGWPLCVWRSVDEALRGIGAIEGEK